MNTVFGAFATLRNSMVAVLVFLLVILPGCVLKKSLGTTDEHAYASNHSSTMQNKKERVNLVYSYGNTAVSKSTVEIIKKFMDKNPGIKVEMQVLPQSADFQYNAYVTALTSGDDSFDVFAGDIVWTPEFSTAGWIKDLGHKFPEQDQARFLKNAIDSCIISDSVFAVPWYTDTGVLFYRKDIIGTAPETWKELVEIARANRDKVRYGFVLQAEQCESLVCNGLEYIWSSGGDVLVGDAVSINTPAAVAGLQTFVDLVNSDIVPPAVTNFQECDSRKVFKQGEAIFMRGWMSEFAALNDGSSPVRGKVGIAALPTDGTTGRVKAGGALGGANLMINASSRHFDEAWKLMEFMTSYEMQVLNNTLCGALPTRKDAYDDMRVREVNSWVQEIPKVLESSKFRPMFPFYPVMSNTMQENFYRAVKKEISSETAVRNIEKDFKDAMARYWIYDLTHFCRINK